MTQDAFQDQSGNYEYDKYQDQRYSLVAYSLGLIGYLQPKFELFDYSSPIVLGHSGLVYIVYCSQLCGKSCLNGRA
jgi:hypothetical protein